VYDIAWNIDREFEFYEFFSFLKFNEFYDFFRLKKIRKNIVIFSVQSSMFFKLFHWKATPTQAFNEFLYEFLRIFLISGKFVKIREFFC